MKETVLVGMTGGVESTVAAYLLKKQGYNCIGIGLQLFEEGEFAGPFEEMMVSDLSKIKAICTYLEIPFYAVNAVSIFKDQVVDFAIGRILSGHTFEPIVFYNRVLIDVLNEKATKFNTGLVATGHYAKILKNQKSGTYEIMVANDLAHDQSYLLSRLSKNHLSGLMLPLAELRKEEVEKIGKLIKVDYIKRNKTNRSHIMHDPRMIPFIEARVAKDLRKPGTFYRYQDDTNLGEHPGVYQYYIGKKGVKIRTEAEATSDLEVVSIAAYKSNIFLSDGSELKHRHALITQFKPADGLDMSLPIQGFVKNGPNLLKLPCIVYFKNNNTCVLEFESEQKGLLVAGQLLVIYNRPGEKGKILGSGIVELGGTFVNGDYHTLPPKTKGDEPEVEENLIPDDKLFF